MVAPCTAASTEAEKECGPTPWMPALIDFGAEEERDLAGTFRRQCRRRAEVVVAGHDDEIGALVDHLEAGLGALGAVGLGVGGDHFDLLAEQAARLVDLVDADHRRILGRLVIGLHEARGRGGEADDDLVVVGHAPTAPTSISAPSAAPMPSFSPVLHDVLHLEFMHDFQSGPRR